MPRMNLILVILFGLFTGYYCVATNKDRVDNDLMTSFGNEFVAYGLEDFQKKATNGHSLKTFFEQLNLYIKMAQVNNQKLSWESYNLVHKSFNNLISQFIKTPNRMTDPRAFTMRLNLLQPEINKFTENAKCCSLILKFAIEWVKKRMYYVLDNYSRTQLTIITNGLANAKKSINDLSLVIQTHINDITQLAGPFNQNKINEKNFSEILAIIDNLEMIVDSPTFIIHMKTSVETLIDLITAHSEVEIHSEDEMHSLDEQNESVYLTPNESDVEPDFEEIIENIRMGIQHLSI